MKSAHPRWSIVAVTILALGASSLFAASEQANIRKALKAESAIEMPAKAAQMVSQAKADDRDATTASVVEAALGVRPASAVAVVGAIAKQTPEAAPAAAARAATLQPKNLSEIASTAASIAPQQAAKIVEAMCKGSPARYATIASVVAKTVPTASKEIVAAMSAAVPALTPFVNRATSDLAKDASFDWVLNRTEMLVAETAKSTGKSPDEIVKGGSYDAIVAPPTLGPPFTPFPGGEPPVVITRADTKVVPPGGGRDYSGP